MNESGPLEPFDYTDVRVYLRDHYDREKKRRRSFSYRQFAQRSETSPGLYKDVVEGRRRLTEETANKFARALGLQAKASDYFLWMARLSFGKSAQEKSLALSRMASLRGKTSIRRLEPDQYEVFRDWHHCAIRELAALEAFREDPDWISGILLPPIQSTKARESLELLERIGLLRRDRRGRLAQAQSAFTSEDDRLSAAVREYHRQMLTLAREALDRLPMPKREVGGATLCTSRRIQERIRERMRIFREEVLAMVVEDRDPPEAVWQLQMCLFPLTESVKPGGEA